jgi:ribonuclease HI
MDFNNSRRSFLKKSALASAAFLFCDSSTLFSKSANDEKWSHQLKLIDDIRKYISDNTGININDSFYTNWQKENKWYYYLYVSKRDKIQAISESNSFYYFGNDYDAALKKKKKFDRKKHHTFIYQTAGTSGTQITERLLSYPDEAIAFILFHESFHHHTGINKCTEPYSFNEATGDVLGNYLTLQYFKGDVELEEKAKQQIANNELIYTAINDAAEKINNGSLPKNASVYSDSKEIVSKALLTCNAFQKDRFNYEINNAYFLKNRYYSENYFLLKDLYLKLSDSKEFLEVICSLPKNESEAIKVINSILEKN